MKRILTEHRKPAIILFLVLFTLFALLILQFYRLQILKGNYWEEKADLQHRMIIQEPFARGRFFSNNTIKTKHPEKPEALVFDVPKYNLYVDPNSIPEQYKAQVTEQLLKLINIPKDSVATFQEQFYADSRSRKLVMWLNQHDTQTIQSWWSQYLRGKKIARNALYFVPDYQRSYPFGSMLGQVLHTIRDVKEETTRQGVPTGGLEMVFNKTLKGKQGKRWMLRSPRNPLESGELLITPENGADIYLTINHTLQAICEDEIAKGAKNYKARSVWACMMDPYTGEILAMAQYPSFFPEYYKDYFNDPDKIFDTQAHCVSYAFEPGSTMKAITVAIALEANKALTKAGKPPAFNPQEKIAVNIGSFPGRRLPITDTHLHYFLNMDLGIQKSSNIYMGKIIQRVVNTLGNDWYRKQLQNTFGFGEKTNIELPAETGGLLPTPGKLHPNKTLEWSVPTPYSLAMGYNLQVNTIQMLRAYSIFANGGYFIQPTLIKKIVKTHLDGQEEVLFNNNAPKNPPQVLDRDTVQRVVRAMKFVTQRGGAAYRGNVPGYTEAGKTGTSRKLVNGQYSQKKYFASFIGFTPVSNPNFVLFVGIDEPDTSFIPGVGQVYYGSLSAAPIFSAIARRSLEYLGVTPDDPYGYSAGDPRSDPEKADWALEVRELEKIYNDWNMKHKL